MNRETVKKLLGLLGVTNSIDTGKWISSSCPFSRWTHSSGKDNHPSFGFHVTQSGVVDYYHCFTCGGGKISDIPLIVGAYSHDLQLVAKLRDLVESDFLGYIQQNESLKPTTVTPFPEMVLGLFQGVVGTIGEQYCYKRGCTKAQLEAIGVLYDPSRSTVCFPIRDFNKNLVGIRGRFLDSFDIPYYDYTFDGVNNSKWIWGNTDNVDFLKPIVLVEGMFDFIKVQQVYSNVLWALGTSITRDKIQWLKGGVEYIVFFDNDNAGRKGTDLVKKLLPECVVKEVGYVNGLSGNDPGELTLDEISYLLNNIGV